MKKALFSIFIIMALTILVTSYELVQNKNITDFRSNPLGGSIKEGLYPVNLLNLGDKSFENSRILAYIDFNEDKK